MKRTYFNDRLLTEEELYTIHTALCLHSQEQYIPRIAVEIMKKLEKMTQGDCEKRAIEKAAGLAKQSLLDSGIDRKIRLSVFGGSGTGAETLSVGMR